PAYPSMRQTMPEPILPSRIPSISERALVVLLDATNQTSSFTSKLSTSFDLMASPMAIGLRVATTMNTRIVLGLALGGNCGAHYRCLGNSFHLLEPLLSSSHSSCRALSIKRSGCERGRRPLSFGNV